MNYIIEICVAIDIAILGIAYPILMDKISHIGGKYNSEYLQNVFDSEFPDNKAIYKLSYFQLILIGTLLSFCFKIFDIEVFSCFKGVKLIENSADGLIFSLTICLTVTFLYWTSKIMLYQGKASELLKFLINKYLEEKEANQSKTYILKAINEFAIFAIEKQDTHLQESLVNFYSKQFQYFRQMSDKNDGVEYPIDLYNVTNEIISASIANHNRKLKALEHRASSGKWLFGEGFETNKISNPTYMWLWRNLILSHTNKELVANYWSSASQFFNYTLSRPRPKYHLNNIINQDEITETLRERKRFLQMNYAFGGLLFYQNEYKSLRYIITFSQSQPPSYPLLPQTMDEIFYWFDQFGNEFKLIDEPIEYKYYFPEIDNLGISSNVRHNICLYIALLFVRQFTQQTIYVYQDFKNFHNLNIELLELYSYNDNLQYFKMCIEKILSNDDLLGTLNFTVNKKEIVATFDELANKIKQKIDFNKLNAQLSFEKIKVFKDKTQENIVTAFDEYKQIENKDEFADADKNIVSLINGELIISSKSSFTESDIPNVNYDSVFSQHIVNSKIKYYLPNSFLLSKTKEYVIERGDLILGLDRILKETKNKVIIAFQPSYDSQNILSVSKYKDLVIEISSTNYHLDDTFFILNRNDLPKFYSEDLPQADIDKFSLNLLDDKYKLYSNVIDVNLPENEDLKKEYITQEEQELKVLILISFIFLIKWKKNRQVIMLSLTSPFKERGVLNSLDDLKELISKPD